MNAVPHGDVSLHSVHFPNCFISRKVIKAFSESNVGVGGPAAVTFAMINHLNSGGICRIK